MKSTFSRRMTLGFMAAASASAVLPFAASKAQAAVTPLQQAIAEAATRDAQLLEFYRARAFKPLFVGKSDRKRRTAILKAFAEADTHGLPVARYNPSELTALMKQAKTARDIGRVEVEAARRTMTYANDVRSGALNPRNVSREIVVNTGRYGGAAVLTAFAKSNPRSFLKSMAPDNPEYIRLQKERLSMIRLAGKGGWGNTVAAASLKPGQSGPAVAQLRQRLARMGYMRRGNSQTYDNRLLKGVAVFQKYHGLRTDGVAGKATMREINRTVTDRLAQVTVAMERQRWNNRPLGRDYVWVNIPDYHVELIENGKTTFRSRVVVGKNDGDRRTPEFSDTMEFMVINPSWYVPRSIVTKEYLPLMKRNRNAQRQLVITGRNGKAISRGAIDFSKYNAKNFPFNMRQPPSKGNALGLVKFMFPNKYNIYLHDTPAKKLFGQQARAFSHGCVRVHEPFKFAYALLKNQQRDPEGYFQSILGTGKERQVNLAEPLPVHLVYYTAWVDAKGRANYRPDVYGRDRAIYAALRNAGVSA